MIATVRWVTGLGCTAALLAGMLAGCGGSTGLTGPMMSKKSRAVGVRGDDAPPTAGGGLRPLPKVTPVPPYQDPKSGGGGDPGEVGRLHSDLRNFGYRGSLGQMADAITAVTHKYPTRWDPQIDTQKHWEWWKDTLSPEIRKDHDTYVRDAVRLAQYRFDVQYFVWVSKQSRGTKAPGTTVPQFDFNKEIPVVKAIAGEQGWIVQISPRGTVVDFLQLPEEFLSDYNHVIPIPSELY